MKPLPGAGGAGAELPGWGLTPAPSDASRLGMDQLRTPCPGAPRAGCDADNSPRLGTGARRVCRQILLCNSHLCMAFPHVQPTLRTSQASPPCSAAPLPRKAQSKNEKQLEIQHDNRAALQSRQHPPAHPAPEQDQTSSDTALGCPAPAFEPRKPAAGRAGKSHSAAAHGEDSPG